MFQKAKLIKLRKHKLLLATKGSPLSISTDYNVLRCDDQVISFLNFLLGLQELFSIQHLLS